MEKNEKIDERIIFKEYGENIREMFMKRITEEEGMKLEDEVQLNFKGEIWRRRKKKKRKENL